jgi:hypothetical protein
VFGTLGAQRDALAGDAERTRDAPRAAVATAVGIISTIAITIMPLNQFVQELALEQAGCHRVVLDRVKFEVDPVLNEIL